MPQLKFLLCNLKIKGCVRKDSPFPPCALSRGRCADWPNWSAPSAFATPRHVHSDGPFPIWSLSLLACRVPSCWTSGLGRVPPLMEPPGLCSSAAGWRRRFPVGKALLSVSVTDTKGFGVVPDCECFSAPDKKMCVSWNVRCSSYLSIICAVKIKRFIFRGCKRLHSQTLQVNISSWDHDLIQTKKCTTIYDVF